MTGGRTSFEHQGTLWLLTHSVVNKAGFACVLLLAPPVCMLPYILNHKMSPSCTSVEKLVLVQCLSCTLVKPGVDLLQSVASNDVVLSMTSIYIACTSVIHSFTCAC